MCPVGKLNKQLGQIPASTSNPIAKADFADFKRLLEVNVHGTFLVTSLVSAIMRDQDAKPVDSSNLRGTTRGCIVNLASISSYIASPTMVPYTTSKHAVLAITKTAGALSKVALCTVIIANMCGSYR